MDDCNGEFGREWFDNDDPLFWLILVVIVVVVFVVDIFIDGTTTDDEVKLSFESVGINNLKKKRKTFDEHATDCIILFQQYGVTLAYI